MAIMGKSRYVVALIALALVPAIAAADPTVSDAQKAQAGDLVKKAIAAAQKGDHATAIELYQQAYLIVPKPLLQSNIATEYQAIGDRAQALKYFCKYLTEDPTGGNAAYATERAKQIQQEMGNTVDDKNVCTVAEPHMATTTNTQTGTGTGTTGTGDTGATGGTQTGTGATTGTNDLEHATSNKTDDGGGNNTMRNVGIGVAGAGVVALGLGVYYGIQAKNASDQITNHPKSDPWPSNIQQIEADGQSDQNKQIGFLIAGGVLAGAGVALVVLGHHGSGEHAVQVAPSGGAHGGGLTVVGRF